MNVLNEIEALTIIGDSSHYYNSQTNIQIQTQNAQL